MNTEQQQPMSCIFSSLLLLRTGVCNLRSTDSISMAGTENSKYYSTSFDRAMHSKCQRGSSSLQMRIMCQKMSPLSSRGSALTPVANITVPDQPQPSIATRLHQPAVHLIRKLRTDALPAGLQSQQVQKMSAHPTQPSNYLSTLSSPPDIPQLHAPAPAATPASPQALPCLHAPACLLIEHSILSAHSTPT
jgi:hypothetical protein